MLTLAYVLFSRRGIWADFGFALCVFQISKLRGHSAGDRCGLAAGLETGEVGAIAPGNRSAQQIKDSCRASFLAAAKSWVELNPENNFRVWSFKAREKGSGAERSGVVCAWAPSKQRIGRVKRGNGSFSRASFSGNQRGGHTAAMAHSEVSADSAGVAGGRTSW